jgi:hypothetical protein
MADHDVQKIIGIGPVMAKALATHGIVNIGQLAKLEPGEIKLNNLTNLIDRARKYVESYKKTESEIAAAKPESKVLVIGAPLGAPTAIQKVDTLVDTKMVVAQVEDRRSIDLQVSEEQEEQQKELKEEEENKYLITDHSWWEMKVLIPQTDTKGHQGQTTLKEAIIYELSVEPHNRISFVCSWVIQSNRDESESVEKLCTMTYSPQLIFYFNLDLPPLVISMREQDYKLLPNHQVLTNVLWETNVLHQFRGDE